MIRGVSAINSAVKKGLMAVVLAGSMYLGATVPMKAKSDPKTQKTKILCI